MHGLYQYFDIQGSGFLQNANTRQPQHTALYALRLESSSLHFFLRAHFEIPYRTDHTVI